MGIFLRGSPGPSVFLQLDDTGSTGMTIHRRTREEKTIYRSVTKVSRANSASLPPERITNGFTVQASAQSKPHLVGEKHWARENHVEKFPLTIQIGHVASMVALIV